MVFATAFPTNFLLNRNLRYGRCYICEEHRFVFRGEERVAHAALLEKYSRHHRFWTEKEKWQKKMTPDEQTNWGMNRMDVPFQQVSVDEQDMIRQRVIIFWYAYKKWARELGGVYGWYKGKKRFFWCAGREELIDMKCSREGCKELWEGDIEHWALYVNHQT